MAVDGRALSPNFGVSGRPKGKPRGRQAQTHRKHAKVGAGAASPSAPTSGSWRPRRRGWPAARREDLNERHDREAGFGGSGTAVGRQWRDSPSDKLIHFGPRAARSTRALPLHGWKWRSRNGLFDRRSGQYLAGGISGHPTCHCQRIGGAPMVVISRYTRVQANKKQMKLPRPRPANGFRRHSRSSDRPIIWRDDFSGHRNPIT